jgi:hypothetical protein
MRYYKVRPKMKSILFPIAVVAYITLSATTLQAQHGAPGPGAPPPNPLGMSDRDLNILEREAQLTMIEKDRRRAVKNDPRLSLTQIKEDFRRLQVLNNEVMRAVSSRDQLDYKYISESAREIKKRAARLKINLVFPEAGSDEKPRTGQDAETPEIKSALAALDGLIARFVTNPVFKEVGVVDTRLGVKAGRDLDEIIELSDKVRKNAERMSKTRN